MKTTYFVGMVFCFSVITTSLSWAGDPVPLPCDPKDCPPIDPCKINPDRCKEKGGPIKFNEISTSNPDQPRYQIHSNAMPGNGVPSYQRNGGFIFSFGNPYSEAALCPRQVTGTASPVLVADAQDCFETCSSQAKTCLRGCDNISDNQQKASCYEGCRHGQEACRGRCK